MYMHMYIYIYYTWSAFEIRSLVRVAIQEGYRTKPVSATRSLAMRDGKVEWTLRPLRLLSSATGNALTMSGAVPRHHPDDPQTGAAPQRSINLKTRPCTVCLHRVLRKDLERLIKGIPRNSEGKR